MVYWLDDDSVMWSSWKKKFYLGISCWSLTIKGWGVFWGKEYSQNIEGVSVVVINHNRGNPLFDNVKDRFEIKKHNLSEIIPL